MGNPEEDNLVDSNTNTSQGLDMENNMNFSLEDPFFEKPFTQEFWDAVGSSADWSHSLLVNRVANLQTNCDRMNKDIIKYFFEKYDIFIKVAESNEKEHLIPGFEQELLKLCLHVIEEDKKNEKFEYLSLIKDDNNTVLHLAAERDLHRLVEGVIKIYPKVCYVKNEDEELPLELAIKKHHDECAALLIKSMKKERVRNLFESKKGKAKTSKLCFRTLSTNAKMKKTTEAVLDCLYEPDFQYSPVPDEKKAQDTWSKLTDEPASYKFYYRLLDGDSNCRPPQIEDPDNPHKLIDNPQFEKRSYSGLYNLAYGPFSEGLISHPVVRQLVQRKWKKYGCTFYVMACVFYIFYILMMTLAYFMVNDDKKDLNSYKTSEDKFRGFCEAVTLLCAILILMYEIEQMAKLKWLYFKDGFNYISILAAALTISWYLAKWFEPMAGSKATKIQWSLASVGYLLTIICVFKYFAGHKSLGVYIRTFIRIIYVEISMFMVVFAIVMAAFTGSVILALRATNGFVKAKMTPLLVLLQEARALLEGEAFANDYVGVFSAGVIVLLLVNMLSVIIILANVLIGQINNTYNAAEANANIQFDVDLLRIIIKLDRGSIFTEHKRIKHYKDMVIESDATSLKEIFTEWKDFKAGKIKNK